MAQSGLAKVKDAFHRGTRLTFDRGEVILHAGEEPEGVHYLESGFVKAYSIRQSGETSLHAVYQAGEFFSLVWAYRNRRTNVFFEAMSPVTLWRLPRQTVIDLTFSHPDVARQMIEQLADIYLIYAKRVENLELTRAYDKVVYRLARLVERFGQPAPDNNGIIIQAPITQQDIADSLNMVRETASREIEKLEAKGIVGYSDHQLMILDPGGLQAELARIR